MHLTYNEYNLKLRLWDHQTSGIPLEQEI